MIQSGRLVKTTVIDHLIITTKSYLSFADIGLPEELEKSTKYVPPYILEERIRKEERKIRKEEITKVRKKEGVKKAIEIAKNLTDVLDIETISIKTGLSVKELEKLRL